MSDISMGEIVRCDCCGCTLDSDFHDIGTCPHCIDGEDLDAYEDDQDWLNGIPTPWLSDEDGYEGDY